MNEAVAMRSIVVERTLPHSPEKVWRALTRAELISQWLMPNDFQPEIGHRFTFKTRPMGDWDGVVQCEVLDSKPHERLRYSWVGGSPSSRLDSVVTWTLTPAGAGTHLRMEHTGFRPENETAFAAMSPGWSRILERIGGVIEANDAGESLQSDSCKA
jgi:uncharacterized protein YndB with AHSA1/START domain